MVRSFIISIHALLAESDARQCYTDTTSVGFLSTLSLRRATAIGRWGTAWRDISIHALLAESDHRARDYTSPQTCISIHALLAESDRKTQRPYVKDTISIHALLAESDRGAYRGARQSRRHFYPRSPCGERRCISRSTPVQAAFLSTLSLRRATVSSRKLPSSCRHFYPRSPCGERRPFCDAGDCTATYFYPRSPCGERRLKVTIFSIFRIFLSTLSLRRATNSPALLSNNQNISIHALLAESDHVILII